MIEALDWQDVTIAGHSMGGAVGIEAAIALGPRIRHVICIDALTYEGFYARQDETTVRRELAPFENDFDAGVHRLVTALFPTRTDQVLIDDIAAGMASTPRRSALSGLRALLEWDRDAALERCPTPVDVIAAQAFLDPDVAARLADEVTITTVDLGGHFYLREDPVGTAAAIRGVVAERAGQR